MQHDWSSYRITLLLYLGVLILPFSFYITYSAMQDVSSGITIIRQLSQTGGEMLAFEQTEEVKNRTKIKGQIDKDLEQLSPWFQSDSIQEFYVGGRTMKEDYGRLLSCWVTLTNDPQDKTAQECWRVVKSLSFTVDKMLLLKQDRVKNIFYINVLLAMTFLLLMIMIVRSYVHSQLAKNSIYDLPTKLFNKKYFLAELKGSCDRSVRYKHPLSMLSIEILDLEKGNKTYDKETKKHILKMFGGLVASLTRGSDVACRCNDNLFSVILPDTQEEGAMILEKRVRQTLEDHNFGAYQDVQFKVATTQFDDKETPEAFIKRTDELLK